MKTVKSFGYVDGFVVAVPKKNIAKYKKVASQAAKVWMDHGALGFYECAGDDVPEGKTTSFSKSVKLKKGEVVFFSWILYKSRAHRNSVLKKAMKDPRLASHMDMSSMPFDSKRMIWGGFKPLVKF